MGRRDEYGAFRIGPLPRWERLGEGAKRKIVFPAKAGIQCGRATRQLPKDWIPDRASGEHRNMQTTLAAA